MIEVGKSYLDRVAFRPVKVLAKAENRFTGVSLVYFNYADEPDLKRELPEAEFERLTTPQEA